MRKTISREASETLERLMAAMAANSPEAVAALYTEDCVIADPLMQTSGRDGLLDAVRQFFTAFRIETIKAEVVAEQPPDLVVLSSWSAIHQGEYLGVCPSGQRFDTWNVMWLRLRDGQICRDTSVWDAGQLRRLEQLAAPGASGSPPG
jgi:steroid delta-isomerase-like uncharacterized protein